MALAIESVTGIVVAAAKNGEARDRIKASWAGNIEHRTSNIEQPMASICGSGADRNRNRKLNPNLLRITFRITITIRKLYHDPIWSTPGCWMLCFTTAR